MLFTRRTFLNAGCSAIAVALSGCSRMLDSKTAENTAWDTSIGNLEKRIPELMNQHRVPGLSIAIIRDARVVWSKGFGVRDRTTGDPVGQDTVFSAQSMSKPVFAYRVMKLYEQGVLDLDAPLTQYTSNVFVDDPRLKEITARRVLSHTTGLPNWRSREDPLKIGFQPGTNGSIPARDTTIFRAS